MNRKTLILLIFAAIMSFATYAQNVSKSLALQLTENFIEYHGKTCQVEKISSYNGASQQLAWIAHLQPDGFVLVSNSKMLRPVLAYSFTSQWNNQGEESLIFQKIVAGDIENRLKISLSKTEVPQTIAAEWEMLSSGTKNRESLEQWPPEGTTPTGGWLFENWTQGSPYNKMCPIDGNTHQRCVNGCPATAMAMILNCLKEINQTLLDDSDDYYHNYGSGNQYWIDDDWMNFEFPRFDSLNLYLDSIVEKYLSHKPLSIPQISALNFACGVTLRQVYTSSISGTFGIGQAADAFQRFGFIDSRLAYDSDTSLCADLAENIKNGWPAQLGLVDPPPTTVGHNVVVDGYNTDDFFHYNFGWGGSSNGWYTMPPASAPYNLTVIEGIVLDIKGNNPHVGIPAQNPEKEEIFELFRDNTSGSIQIQSNAPRDIFTHFIISNSSGQIVEQGDLILKSRQTAIHQPKDLKNGIYIFTIFYKNELLQSLKFSL